MSRNKIGMQVRLQDMGDFYSQRTRLINVNIGVALWINNSSYI